MIKFFSSRNKGTAKASGLLFRKILFNLLGFITFVSLFLGITFTFFSGQILKSQITKSSEEVLRQILYNLDQVITFIDNSTISLGTNGLIDITLKSEQEPMSKFSEYQDIMETLWTMKNTNRYIHSVMLYLEKDGKVISSQGSITDIDKFSKYLWVDAYKRKENSFIDTYSIYDDIAGKNVNIMSIIKILPLANKNLQYGALIVNLDAQQVNSTINSDRVRKNEQILILDHAGRVISSDDTGLLYKSYPWSQVVAQMSGTTGTYETKIAGTEHYIIFHSMPKYGWKVVSIIPTEDLFSDLDRLLICIAVIIAIGFFLFFPIVGIFSKKMYSPIQKLVNLLKQESTDISLLRDDIKFINKSIEDILNDRKITAQMLERIKPVAQEKYIKSLVTGGPDSQQMNKAFMQTIGIEFAHEHFIAVVIAVDNSLKWDHPNMNLVQISFMSTFKDNLKASIEDSGYSNYIIQLEDFRIAVLINSSFDDQQSIDNIYMMCLELKEHIARENSYTITAGIGNPVYNISEIKTSYQQAILALEQKLIFGKNSVIRICDIQESSNKTYSNKDFIESVIKNIKDLDMDGAINAINHMTDMIITQKVGSRALHKFFYSLLNIITFTISSMGVNTELVFSSNSDLIDDFLKNEDVEDIKKWFYNIFKRLEEVIAQKESNAPSDILKRVKEYLHANYMKDISLSNIADVVYLHPHYLGKLFKKHEGISITEYLTCVRIERAKELLKEGNIKIADISQLVGMSSPQYFIHCFKSYQGMTPKSFREMNRLPNEF